MAETTTLPHASPEAFDHEEAIAISANRLLLEADFDRLAEAYYDPTLTEEEQEQIVDGISAVVQRNLSADRLYFVAAKNALASDEIDDHPEEVGDQLADIFDGPFRAPRYDEETGEPEQPPEAILAEAQKLVNKITHQETTGAAGHEIELEENRRRLATARAALTYFEQEGDAAQAAIHREAVLTLSLRLDNMEGTTERSDAVVMDSRLQVVNLRINGVAEDAPEMQAAKAFLDTTGKRVEKVLATNPHVRLRQLLRDYPEATDIITQKQAFHAKYVEFAERGEHSKKGNKESLHVRLEALHKAEAKLQAVPAEGDFLADPDRATLIEADRAIAQAAVHKAKAAVAEAAGFVSQEAAPLEVMEGLLHRYDADKIAREDQEKAFGELRPLEDQLFNALLTWREGKTEEDGTEHEPKPSDEHAVFAGMKKLEDYISALDERMAVAGPGHRAWETMRQMRVDAFGAYLRGQYLKEQVRADYLDRTGSAEGRNGFAYMPDKGMIIERANGRFVIYPDESYAAINDDNSRGTRLTASGEEWTAPEPHPYLQPGQRIPQMYEQACLNAPIDQLIEEERTVYVKWFRDQDDPIYHMQQAIVARVLRERLEAEPIPDLAHASSLAYAEYFVRAGGGDPAIELQAAGTIKVTGATFLKQDGADYYAIPGDWILHPTGAAELFAGDRPEPYIFASDGRLIGEEEPEPVPAPPTPPAPPAPPSGGGVPSGTPRPPAPGAGSPSSGTPPSPAALRPRRENPLFDGGDDEGATPPVPPRRSEGRTAADDILGPRPAPRTGVPTPGDVFPRRMPPEAGTRAAGAAPTPPTPPGGGEGAPEGGNALNANRERHRVVEAAAAAAKGSIVIHTSIVPQEGHPIQLKTPLGTRKPDSGFQSFGDGYKGIQSGQSRGGPYNVILEETSRERIWFSPLLEVPAGVPEPTSGNIPESWKVQVVSPAGDIEPGVEVSYSFEAPDAVKYEAAGGGDPRGGNVMFVRATLPESVANQLLEAVKADPTAARNLAYRLFVSNADADLWDGEQGQQPARPPYDVVDRLPEGWNLSIIDDKPGSVKVSNVPFPRR